MPSKIGKTSGKRRVRKFRLRRRRIPRNIAHANPKMIYDIVLNAKVTTLVIPAAGGVFNFAPSLSNVASTDLGAFQELYDEFKITGFSWQLIPRGNVISPYANATTNTGYTYFSVIDYTDTNTLASADDALEYSTCKKHSSWKKAGRKVACMVPQLIHDCNNNPMITVVKPRWMQLETQTISGTPYDDTIVAHLGCKLFFPATVNLVGQIYDKFLKLHVQFKNKK